MTTKPVSAAQLKAWIDARESVAIVDVRDSDRVGGHIRTSLNVPSISFLSSLPKLGQHLNGFHRVVFHCQLSQQRGPTCAKQYARHIHPRAQEVYVLSGGFQEWARKYGRDPRVTEGYVADIYEY